MYYSMYFLAHYSLYISYNITKVLRYYNVLITVKYYIYTVSFVQIMGESLHGDDIKIKIYRDFY